MNPLIAARIGATFLVFSVCAWASADCAWAIAGLYVRWFDNDDGRTPHPSMSDDDWEQAINELRWEGER